MIKTDYFDPSKSPLLEKFRELAPGSYKHCLNVSNMCETIAMELDLDKELLKCAALYHDIGKINNPIYFSENQPSDENPHDSLDPLMSTMIITKHISEGVMILFQNDFPKEVIKIISQHHGDSVVQAFYNKAKKTQSNENKFRYKADKPQDLESALLMIVDSVEATAKSKFTLSKENDKSFVQDVITTTIDRLADDNQLDNMTLGVLKVVKNVLKKELESVYHKRVVYDDDDDDKDDEKKKAQKNQKSIVKN